MLLFSSRDHHTLPGICLWVLFTTVQIQCSYAFNILSHKDAAPSVSLSSSPSSSSTSISSSAPSSSSPSSSPTSSLSSFPLSPFSSLSSLSKLNMLFPNKLYFRNHQHIHSRQRASSKSLKRSVDTPRTSRHRIFRREISRLTPHLPSSPENLISFTTGNEMIEPVESLEDSWSTGTPILKTTPPAKLGLQRPFSTIASIKEKQKLRSYFRHVEKMNALKSALRQKIKTKAILKSKMLKAVNLKTNRLTKMANVQAMALSKSPPKIQKYRSMKSRRANFFAHQHHHAHLERPGSQSIDPTAGSFVQGFGDGGGFVNPENVRVFQGFDLGKDSVFIPGHTDGFILDHLPNHAQVDFVVNSQGNFLTPSPSQHGILPQPLSSSSSAVSSFVPSSSSSLSSSSSSSSSIQHEFGEFPSQSNQNTFGGFIDSPQKVSWQALPPVQQPQQADRFGRMLSSSSDMPGSMFRHEGEFHMPPPVNEGSASSPWGQSDIHSSFSTHGDGFSSGFGSFQQDDRDCASISTKICHSSRDCLCNGFYTCMGSKCVVKGSSSGGNDPIGGIWHDGPVVDSVVAQRRHVPDKI